MDKSEDYYIQKRRGWIRLHEKGGKITELPCHHNLEQFLDEWLSTSGLSDEPDLYFKPGSFSQAVSAVKSGS